MHKMRTQLQPLPLPPKPKQTPPCTHPIRTLRIPKTAFPNPALHKGTSSSFTVVSLWPSSLQQFAWLSVVLPLRTNSRVHGDSTKGTFYFGSKEEMGFFSISFNVASVQVEGNTAKLELTWWDELENKDIIVPATLSLRTDSAKIDITVGNEDTPELECGGYGYIFPVTFTLDRISDRTTPENGDESGNEPETANEPTAEMVETDAPTEKTTDVTEEDYSQPFRGTWSWTDEMIHNDYYDDDIPAAVVTLKLDFYNANSVKGDGGTADGWMNLATTSPQRVSENKITLNEVIGNKAFITVLDGYSEMAEYQATITFNPANKTLEFELGDLIGELDENQAFIAGQSPTGNYSRVILKRKSE